MKSTSCIPLVSLPGPILPISQSDNLPSPSALAPGFSNAMTHGMTLALLTTYERTSMEDPPDRHGGPPTPQPVLQLFSAPCSLPGCCGLGCRGSTAGANMPTQEARKFFFMSRFYDKMLIMHPPSRPEAPRRCRQAARGLH